MRQRFTRVRLGEGLAGALDKDRTDWRRVDALSEAQLARALAEDPDTFEVEPAWLDKAELVRPAPRKERITASFDADLLAWFRRQGKGYQTRMNAVLRAYYEAHRDKSRS